MYESEQALVDDLVTCLRSASTRWRDALMVREFYYQRGRADVVAVTPAGDVVAFEAKTRRWRDALHQAYRNTCFAHQSYVVLPFSIAVAAHRHLGEFRRRGVGLCSVSDGEITVLREACDLQPIQPWLTQQVMRLASE